MSEKVTEHSKISALLNVWQEACELEGSRKFVCTYSADETKTDCSDCQQLVKNILEMLNVE